jgi:hypothetical protein
MRGESVDMNKMLTASEALARLLPPAVLATAPEEQRSDPREVMFKIYMQMRERGEVPPEGWHQRRINELEAEIERLKAQLGLAPALPDVAPLVESVPRGGSAIFPSESDITPPAEIGECHVGSCVGPDDPPPRPPIIDGRAVPISPRPPPDTVPPAGYDYSANQDWKNWIEPDGSIRSTPRGPGRYWGPV